MLKKISIFAGTILLLLCSVSQIPAQSYDATSMGMGGAYGAVSRGVNAIAWNPANLALPRSSWFELNFIGVNLNVANSSLTIDNYEKYLTQAGHGGEWDDKEIDELIALVPDDGFSLNGELNANALGLAIGPFGVSVQFLGNAQGIIPKGPFELMLKGNTKSYYDFGGTDADGYSTVKVSLAASHKIPVKKYFDVFALGLNLNYFRAIGYGEISEARGSFITGLEYIHSDILLTGRTAESGNGFGLDFGAAGVINKKLTVSMSFQNLLGSINWNSGTERFYNYFMIDSAQYKEDLTIDPVDTNFTEKIGEFSTRLPVVFHLGLAYELKPNLTLALDVEQAFKKAMGYSDQAKLSVGAEFRPTPIVPLRAGFTIGGKWDFALGLGIGFHMKAVQFDFGYSMHRAAWFSLSKGFSTAFNIRIAI